MCERFLSSPLWCVYDCISQTGSIKILSFAWIPAATLNEITLSYLYMGAADCPLFRDRNLWRLRGDISPWSQSATRATGLRQRNSWLTCPHHTDSHHVKELLILQITVIWRLMTLSFILPAGTTGGFGLAPVVLWWRLGCVGDPLFAGSTYSIKYYTSTKFTTIRNCKWVIYQHISNLYMIKYFRFQWLHLTGRHWFMNMRAQWWSWSPAPFLMKESSWLVRWNSQLWEIWHSHFKWDGLWWYWPSCTIWGRSGASKPCGSIIGKLEFQNSHNASHQYIYIN